MDASYKKKFVIVFAVCVCIVILFIYMPVIYTHSRKINILKKFMLKTTGRVNIISINSKMTLNSQTQTNRRKIPDFITYADPNVISLRHLLAVCVKAVQVGGIRLQEIRKRYDLRQYKNINALIKALNPVPAGSHHSYKAMYYILKKSFPELKIVSQYGINKEYKYQGEGLPDLPWIEFDDASEDMAVSAKDILVWLDPLDASRDFHANNLQYVTTMVCVAIKGKPVIGVIHQPFENVTMWGWDGILYSNATLGSISKQSAGSVPTLITSSLHALELRVNANRVLVNDINIVPASGAGYKMLQLAVGNVDAYIHAAPINKWDLCAGNAIIKALNGNLTRFNGKSIDYGNPSAALVKGGIFGTIHEHERYFDLMPATNETSDSF